MAQKYLIVVDMQEDFVYGSLGSPDAQEIVAAVVKKINEFDGTIIFTKDTHDVDYLQTQEGKYLPVEHCIRGTQGWELIEPLRKLQETQNYKIYEKDTFGCVELAADLKKQENEIVSIEWIGLCTDICVVSNVLLVKACMPQVPMYVDAGCCAGVTKEKHEAALETMRSCQIQMIS